MRTIAEGHGLEDLKRDLRYLSRLWARLKKKAETVKAPGLVHKEVDISLEVDARPLQRHLREPDRRRSQAAQGDRLVPRQGGAGARSPRCTCTRARSRSSRAYGIEEQIAKALERRVPLPSGGNLMIDHAEALTVIDVNTGRFTGGKGLEDTITKTNLEAAREVVRQLRLRDIGGIIIIDFIDMAHAKNREMVLATLRGRAGDRPHQDLRGRALASRARRDDAAEHHRRRARHPDARLSVLPGQGARAQRRRPWR